MPVCFIDKMMNNTRYTVQKITKSDKFFGPIHGAMDDQKTVCGLNLDSNWYILSNMFDGLITCKKCLKKIHED